MKGTFLVGDCLKIEKIFSNKLCVGDVVTFQYANKIKNPNDLVHRIVSISGKDFFTRGDNNPKNDEEAVRQENIIGKVTSYERSGKIHKVWNGKLGMMRASVLHGRLHVVRAVKFFLRKPYRILKKVGIVSKLWRPKIETIYFKTQDGPLIKYTQKGRTVANHWTETNRWWFKRPYDFIIDPKAKAKGKR